MHTADERPEKKPKVWVKELKDGDFQLMVSDEGEGALEGQEE